MACFPVQDYQVWPEMQLIELVFRRAESLAHCKLVIPVELHPVNSQKLRSRLYMHARDARSICDGGESLGCALKPVRTEIHCNHHTMRKAFHAGRCNEQRHRTQPCNCHCRLFSEQTAYYPVPVESYDDEVCLAFHGEIDNRFRRSSKADIETPFARWMLRHHLLETGRALRFFA